MTKQILSLTRKWNFPFVVVIFLNFVDASVSCACMQLHRCKHYTYTLNSYDIRKDPFMKFYVDTINECRRLLSAQYGPS